MRKTPLICTTLLLGAGTLAFGNRAAAAEFGDATPYYEDDSWLDVTEWLDGNDYNPTDESWARWDDETYDSAEDVSGDRDSDWTYGFADPASADSDWFYDYYDATPYYLDDASDNLYTYGAHYYDYDNDGSYDAYLSYNDWDADGLYESYAYYTFNEAGDQQKQQQAQKDAPKQSKAQKVSGTVQKTKLVDTRQGQHTVVAIQQEGNKTTIVDLGKTDRLKDLNPELGSKLTASGPMTKVGEHNVVMAKSVEAGGKTMQIDRSRKEITGKVLSTHKATVRGAEHLIAMVETEGDSAGKVVVDLGPAKKLEMDVKKGSELTFTAVPIKVQGKRLMMAQTVEQPDGKQASIERQMKPQAKPAGASN